MHTSTFYVTIFTCDNCICSCKWDHLHNCIWHVSCTGQETSVWTSCHTHVKSCWSCTAHDSLNNWRLINSFLASRSLNIHLIVLKGAWTIVFAIVISIVKTHFSFRFVSITTVCIIIFTDINMQIYLWLFSTFSYICTPDILEIIPLFPFF